MEKDLLWEQKNTTCKQDALYVMLLHHHSIILKNHSPTGENISQHALTKSCNFNKKRGCCGSSCRDFKESLKVLFMHCGKTENQLHIKKTQLIRLHEKLSVLFSSFLFMGMQMFSSTLPSQQIDSSSTSLQLCVKKNPTKKTNCT